MEPKTDAASASAAANGASSTGAANDAALSSEEERELRKRIYKAALTMAQHERGWTAEQQESVAQQLSNTKRVYALRLYVDAFEETALSGACCRRIRAAAELSCPTAQRCPLCWCRRVKAGVTSQPPASRGRQRVPRQ